MKRIPIASLILCAALALTITAQQRTTQSQAAEAALGAAIHQEEAEGNLEGAIASYKKFLSQYGNIRPLAANAQYHLGLAYEKLGDAEARKAYERVAREFSDQKEIATAAGRRLAAMSVKPTSENPAPRVVANVNDDKTSDDYQAVSFDGRWMTVTRWSGAGKNDNELAIQDMSTGQRKRLVVGFCGKPCTFGEEAVLSPDSRQVAYTWYDDAEIDGQGQLRVMANETGAKPRVLFRDREFSSIGASAWSPDGRSILVEMSKKDDRTRQLGWVSAADGTIKILKSLEWRHPSALSLSPDGRYIAYSALATNPSKVTPAPTDPTDTHIYILAADGSSEVEVVKTASVSQSPVWTPDGAHIVFTSNLSGKSDLWSVAIQNGKPAGSTSLIRGDIGEIVPIGITRSGSYYYVQRKAGFEQVSIAELMPDGASRNIESFVGMNPTWSPDGKSLAFSRHSARDNLDLVVRSVETGEERAYNQKSIALSYPSGLRATWRHDASGLFQCMNDSSSAWLLYFIDKKSGEFKNALQPAVNLATCSSLFFALSPDDKTVYFAQRTNPDFFDRIVSIELGGGQPKTVLMLPGTLETLPRTGREITMALSPDGRTLAIMMINHKTREESLAVVQVDGSGLREIYKLARPGNPMGDLAWAKDGRTILFATTTDGVNGNWQIMRIGIDGGKPEFTGLTVKALSKFDLSPDDSRIAFSATAGAPPRELVAIDNLPALLKDLR